jgi:hypothetical protein
MEEMQSQSPLGRLETTEHSIGEAKISTGKTEPKPNISRSPDFLEENMSVQKPVGPPFFWCLVDRIIHRLR